MYWSEGRLRAVMDVDSGNLVFINHAVKSDAIIVSTNGQ